MYKITFIDHFTGESLSVTLEAEDPQAAMYHCKLRCEVERITSVVKVENTQQ